MSNRKFIFFLISIIFTYLIFIGYDTSLYETISILITFYFFIVFLDSLGKSYDILSIPILIGAVQLLIMPMLVYRIYNDLDFVILINANMKISEEKYYGFMTPAFLAMIVGLTLPFSNKTYSSDLFFKLLKKTKENLKQKSTIGIIMMIFGAASVFFEAFISAEYKYLFYLLSKLLFIGIIYIYFSNIKNKLLYLSIGLIVLLGQAIYTAMFGELVFSLFMITILLILGKKFSMSFKLFFFSIGFILLFIIQSIKAEYRGIVWFGNSFETTSNAESFFTLIKKRFEDPSILFDDITLFGVVSRVNQGMIQSEVMDYIPRVKPFAGGQTIFNSIAASFVPRFLWPDKPNAGGHWNMEYFTGQIIKGYSMNIGPFGEAYGNFGLQGGIIFMFFYGLFFNIMLFLLLRVTNNYPTLILWFPILFLNSIHVETDILMTVNSLIKNCLFVAFCYWSVDRFLRIKL